MVKLKIGSVVDEDKKKVDPLSLMSDSELEELEKEVDESTEEVKILEEMKYDISLASKYLEEFPNKKIIYRGKITKSFFNWYIKKANLTQLKKIAFDIKYYSGDLAQYISAVAKERDAKDFVIELETKEDMEKYEELIKLLYPNEVRAKAIWKLDDELRNLMVEKNVSESEAINMLLEECKAPNGDVSEELWNKTILFQHLNFLYELMSSKMDFTEPPTEEEIEKIKKIRDLLMVM